MTKPLNFYLSLFVMLFITASCSLNTKKQTVGETARILVAETRNNYLARIDTGARITSIHATNITVKDGLAEKTDNVGKLVSFVTGNENQQQSKVTATIAEVAKVRNAQGVEYRYVVNLNLLWKGDNKTVLVNLRDRSAMTYKLLIGRNWLADDFIVDVNQSEGVI